MDPHSSDRAHLLLLLLLLLLYGNPLSIVSGDINIEAFAEMRVLNSAIWTRDHLGIIREKVESLVRMDDKLATIVALKRR